MGNLFSMEPPPPPPPPLVLVPPLFDFPPLASRSRMLESSFDLLFGKLALKCLFEDYFEEARHVNARIMLKPIDDPHVDLVATKTPGSWPGKGVSIDFSSSHINDMLGSCVSIIPFVSSSFDRIPEEVFVGNALFRWQSDVDDPHTFMDLFVSNSDPVLRMRSSAYYPKYGFGAFGILPLLAKKRSSPEDYGLMGLRYGSTNLSVGVTVTPFPTTWLHRTRTDLAASNSQSMTESTELSKNVWLVSKIGRITAGVQYEPLYGTKDNTRWKDLRNWSCAVGYGLGSTSPLSPSFNFGLELAKGSQFIASFYQHAVVQRRVKNPFEEDEVVGITNYIDFGFELQTRMDDAKTSAILDSTFQVAASWQANKNFLLKGKTGPLSSTLSMAFKSWWQPSFSFSISATRDRTIGKTSFGFGLRVENLRQASYERADPNYIMLIPNKEHLAEGMLWKTGKRPVLQSDVDSGNFDGLPRDLRPLEQIL